MPVEGSIEEQTQHSRAQWSSRPWDLAHKCQQVKPEELRPGEQCAQEWCAKFGQQLHSQKDTLQIQEALPDTNLQKFTGKLGVAWYCYLTRSLPCLDTASHVLLSTNVDTYVLHDGTCPVLFVSSHADQSVKQVSWL